MKISKHFKVFFVSIFILSVLLLLSSCAKKSPQKERGVKLESLNLKVPTGTVLLARVYGGGAEELQMLTFEKEKPKGKNVEVGSLVDLGKEKFYPVFKKLQSGFIGEMTKDAQEFYFVEIGNLYFRKVESTERKLISDVGDIVFLTLSPDEKKVAFLSNNKNNIYVYDVEKDKVKTFPSLLEPTKFDEGKTFPPIYHLDWLNNEEIIFSNSDLMVLNVITGKTRSLTETEDVYEAYFSLSPKKDKLIFYDYESYGLFLLDLKSKEALKVNNVEGYVGIPYPFTWTPDGKIVAFEIGGEDVGFFEIWVLSTEKREILKRLKGKGGKFLFTPCISPDGNWLLYQEWVRMERTGEVNEKDKEIYLYLSPLKDLDEKIILYKTTYPDNGFRALSWK
jgi:Tol biopolymer transport system component